MNELSNLTFIKFYLHSGHLSVIKNKLFSSSPLISVLIIISSSSSSSSSLFFIFYPHRAQHPYQPNLEFRPEWNRIIDVTDLNGKLNRWFNLAGVQSSRSKLVKIKVWGVYWPLVQSLRLGIFSCNS